MNEQPNVSDWHEAKPPRGEHGPIYGFRRGYKVRDAGRHETADQYACFQKFMLLQGERTFKNLEEITGHSSIALSKWAQVYNWQKRAAAYDKEQMALVWKQVEKTQRNAHKEAIIQFRDSSERQARMMSRVAEDLLRVVGKRVAQAEDEGEELPMALVAGLLRSAANISDQSRQSWANALGINEMLEMVESEMQKVDVSDVTEVDAYDIPLDE